MGYYTSYTLKVKDFTNNRYCPEWIPFIIDIIPTLCDLIDKEGNSIGDTKDCPSEISDIIKKISISYPSILFELYSEGEDNKDLACTYIYNGKYYISDAIITYPKFDINKLV